MISFIRQLIFAWHYRRAVGRANKMAELCKCKYYVILMNGKLKVVPKRTIRELVRSHRFRKGVTVADIEKRALYVTL